MIHEFVASAGGDGECFAFIVNKQTFINIMGIEEYNKEMEYRKEFHDEVFSQPGSEPFVEPTEWPIYPHVFFNSKCKLKIKIEVEETPLEEYAI